MQSTDFSKYEGFYQLSDKDNRGAVHLQPADNNPEFPYLEILRNGPVTKTPLTFSIKKAGSRWGDLVYAGWPSLYLVSTELHDALKGLVGIKFYSTLIVDSTTEQSNDSYFGLVATGRSGPIIKECYTQEVASNEFISEKKGIFFDLNSWDGSDFFIPADTALLIVTEKVKCIIEQQKPTNVSLTRLTDLINYIL